MTKKEKGAILVYELTNPVMPGLVKSSIPKGASLQYVYDYSIHALSLPNERFNTMWKSNH